MKKLLSVVALIAMLTLASCNKAEETSTTTENTTTTETTTGTEAPAAE